jgi:hypothetical protein
MRWKNPAELAATAARTLCGVQIRCAQCHDHPFDKYKQEDFWAFAAFFSRVRTDYYEGPRDADGNYEEIYELSERHYGNVDQFGLPAAQRPMIADPRYLNGVPHERKPGERDHRRKALAEWLTGKDNAYFSRAMVNRIWAQLLGRGLFHPVDHWTDSTKVSHPDLLERLSREFGDQGFDLRKLIRWIASSKAYQLSCTYPGEKRPDPALFAVMPARRLSKLQLFQATVTATGVPMTYVPDLDEDGEEMEINPETGKPMEVDLNEGYQYEFKSADSPVEVLLLRMNGSLTQSGVSDGKRVQELEEMEVDEAVEWLFLSTLSRPPGEEEASVFSKYLRRAPGEEAYSDILWVLLNSTEFGLNH